MMNTLAFVSGMVGGVVLAMITVQWFRGEPN
jgi:hypothetical protein